MEIFKLLSITLGAILANNFIFSQFLGCCPFLGVSKKVDTAVGMGVAVTFVMGLASAVCFVVNCIILGRAEAFSYKNGMVASFFDGIFQGIGYTWVLLAMCIIREFLGGGTFGGGVLGAVNEAGQHVGIQIFPADYGIGMLTLPVGGFLVLAALIAAMQWALARPKKDKEESK